MDTAIHSKAILAENIISLMVRNFVSDEENLQKIASEIKEKNQELQYLKIYVPTEDKQSFRLLFTNNEDEKNKEESATHQLQNLLAWNDPKGIAFLDYNKKGRFWNVTKAIIGENGEKKALISISFSLSDLDKITKETVLASYIILFFTIIVVLLLVVNNARLFSYAFMLSKLKEIDAMKDTFISMASHELKAPLVSMKGNVEFLREEIEPHINEDGRHYIENIAHLAERLEVLVGDILEVSRLEGNRLPINIMPSPALPIIEKSLEEIRNQAEQKGLALNFEKKDLPKVKVDPDRTKQILINLISNAIKYTVKGKIEILTEVKDGKLLITVADTGVGISAEDQAKLFQKFSRIYNEETREVSGTGLGLWISRELARKMGGDITVESIRGVGSHFTLYLPLA